jgi:hypothetical protein
MRSITLSCVLTAGSAIVGAQSHQHHAPATTSPAALQQILDVETQAASLSTPDLARTAGYESALGWIPMMGTHWVHGQRVLQGRPAVTVAEPSQLMFSPVNGKETLVGVAYAYYAPLKDAASPPVLFDGAPAWHDHPDLSPPGTNMLMLHVWFVASPDGPFAGLNPYLPYWAAGVTPPPVDRMRDPAVAVRVRKAAVGLAEIVDTAGLFPVLARRPAVRPVLDEQRGAIRLLVPELEAARQAGDQARWDALLDKVGEHWDTMREAYLKSALDPGVRSRIARAIDDMIQGSHSHQP